MLYMSVLGLCKGCFRVFFSDLEDTKTAETKSRHIGKVPISIIWNDVDTRGGSIDAFDSGNGLKFDVSADETLSQSPRAACGRDSLCGDRDREFRDAPERDTMGCRDRRALIETRHARFSSWLTTLAIAVASIVLNFSKFPKRC